MIKTIWKKELLCYWGSRSSIYCTLIIVSLIWIIGLLRITSYERMRIEKDRLVAEIADELREIDGYSNFRTKIVRTPSSLEVFNRGVTESRNSVVPIEIYEIPLLYTAEKHTLSNTGNPLLVIIGAFDVVHVIQIFLSLLAILLSCKSISAEKEKGTLSIILTTNVSRMKIAMGKFISGITILNVPILLGFLGLSIGLVVSNNISVTEEDWVSLIGLWAVSLFYIAIFYLIGMAISCCTHSTATSLIYGLFLWVLLVVVLPNSIVFFVNQQINQSEITRMAEDVEEELWREYRQKVNNLVRTAGMGDTYPPLHLLSDMYGYGSEESRPMYQIGPIRENAPISDFLNILGTGEKLRLQYAQKVWNACRPLWEDLPRSLTSLNNQLQRITPTGAYMEVSSGLASTDEDAFYDFIDQSRQYREQLLEYLRAYDAFRSKEFLGGSWMIVNNVSNKTVLDLSDLPAFQERRESLFRRLDRIAPGFLSLLLYASLMWLAVVGLFSRYDVTR